MRRKIDKVGRNRLPGVMEYVGWFERHIQANGYGTKEEAHGLLVRKLEDVKMIIPARNKGLIMELDKLI